MLTPISSASSSSVGVPISSVAPIVSPAVVPRSAVTRITIRHCSSLSLCFYIFNEIKSRIAIEVRRESILREKMHGSYGWSNAPAMRRNAARKVDLQRAPLRFIANL